MRHIRFLVEKSKVYNSSALMGYDSEMRERAEFFGTSVFSYGDHNLSHRWLGVVALKPALSTSSLQSQSSSKKKGKVSKFGPCWAWNESKTCKRSPCKFKHICSSCQGDLKVSDCSTKSVQASKTDK